jgi:hypothetical protein
LRYWLAAAGVDPDRDVVLRVLPPSLMVEALRSGEIDGFIAGAPWSNVAVAEGLAEMVAVGARIWQRGIEKVLAFRADWLEAHPEAVDRLLVALAGAAAWCDDPANRQELARLLAEPGHVGEPVEHILPALAARMPLRADSAAIDVPDFLHFNREAAGFPWRSQALWIYSQFVRWKMVDPSAEHERIAAETFRPDVYRRALGSAGLPMPGASMKLEGALAAPLAVGAHRGALTLGPDRFFDGRIFDPQNLTAYLDSFDPR